MVKDNSFVCNTICMCLMVQSNSLGPFSIAPLCDFLGIKIQKTNRASLKIMFFICENHKKSHKILSVTRRVRSIFHNDNF